MKTQDQEDKHKMEAYTHMKKMRKSENTGGRGMRNMVKFWHKGIEKKNKHI